MTNLSDIGERYNVNIFRNVEHDANEAYQCGRDIGLGRFRYDEQELCAVYHEIGHTLIDWAPGELKIETELRAWQEGFRLMLQDGHTITALQKSYAISRLSSYIDWEWREHDRPPVSAEDCLARSIAAVQTLIREVTDVDH
jgi:hypothetical protein